MLPRLVYKQQRSAPLSHSNGLTSCRVHLSARLVREIVFKGGFMDEQIAALPALNQPLARTGVAGEDNFPIVRAKDDPKSVWAMQHRYRLYECELARLHKERADGMSARNARDRTGAHAHC